LFAFFHFLALICAQALILPEADGVVAQAVKRSPRSMDQSSVRHFSVSGTLSFSQIITDSACQFIFLVVPLSWASREAGLDNLAIAGSFSYYNQTAGIIKPRSGKTPSPKFSLCKAQ